MRGSLVESIRARTPARLLVGRSGPAYRSGTQLELRLDHAAARDAVNAELDAELLKQLKLLELRTHATSKAEFLLRPDLGRRLSDEAVAALRTQFPTKTDLQIVVGDGLSATAVAVQIPGLLPRLIDGAAQRGWSVGRPFAVRYCRVGILNDVGEVLAPAVVVLLIGERPGLATAESLSAYLAYCPRPGHTDAQRNLVSNIHVRGVNHDEAVRRILNLADTMIRLKLSGVDLKETLGPPSLAPAAAALASPTETPSCRQIPLSSMPES